MIRLSHLLVHPVPDSSWIIKQATKRVSNWITISYGINDGHMMTTGESQVRTGSHVNGCNGGAVLRKSFRAGYREQDRIDNDRGAGWVSMRYDVAFYVAQCSAK